MITVQNVTQHYRVRVILNNVSLHVRKGELLALMGPNGMGKTTLLGVMAGLLAPISGFVEIDGKRRRGSPDEERAIRQQVMYLPADAWTPTTVTGREWLLAVGRVYGVDDLRLMDHADRLLALFNLAEQGNAPISSYSTGQRRKIAIAGALVAETPILLLDEPFGGGLDPSAILALKRVLKWLVKERGVTVVLATPVPELVEELADRVAVIRDGTVAACDTIAGLRQLTNSTGSLDEVYERLASPQTAGNVDAYLRDLSR